MSQKLDTSSQLLLITVHIESYHMRWSYSATALQNIAQYLKVEVLIKVFFFATRLTAVVIVGTLHLCLINRRFLCILAFFNRFMSRTGHLFFRGILAAGDWILPRLIKTKKWPNSKKNKNLYTCGTSPRCGGLGVVQSAVVPISCFDSWFPNTNLFLSSCGRRSLLFLRV